MKRLRMLLLTLPWLAMPLGAQTLSDRFKENYKVWEMTLERGDGAAVRKAVDALLQKEGLTVSRSDYNEMKAMVAVLELGARASVEEGAWEDAIAYLQRASSTAAENAETSSATFSKIRQDHEAKLTEWRAEATKTEAKLKELDAQPGLNQDLLKQRTMLKDSLDEYRNAIAHSGWAIKEIDGLLDRVKADQASDTKALAAWQDFLAKEKQEVAQAGSPQKYVADKLVQVKADETRPRFERMAYARRLQRLDPTNKDVRTFVYTLLGLDDSGDEAPTSAPTAKPKAKTKAPAKAPAKVPAHP